MRKPEVWELRMKWPMLVLFLSSCLVTAQQATVPHIPYHSVPDFLQLPPTVYFGEVPGVAVNSKKHVFVFSRGNTTGPAYGAAFMGALCIREMTGVRAAAHTGAGFRHGPLLDVNETHVAIILAMGRGAELGVRLAKDCVRRGGKVILVSSEPQEASERLMPVQIARVAEPWEAIASILVPQALTLGMVEKNGAILKPRFSYGPMME